MNSIYFSSNIIIMIFDVKQQLRRAENSRPLLFLKF